MLIKNRYRAYGRRGRYGDQGCPPGYSLDPVQGCVDANGCPYGTTWNGAYCAGTPTTPPGSTLTSVPPSPGATSGSNPVANALAPAATSIGQSIANVFNRLLGNPTVGMAPPPSPGIDIGTILLVGGIAVGGYFLIKKA